MLTDLVFVLVAGAAATILAYRLKQPVVLGYLVAGVAIGPHAAGLVRDLHTIEQLAELGIIFLMLGVGLEFDLRKLRNVGIRAVVVASVQIGLMLTIGYATGRHLGWSPMDSVFLGAIISISSTVIIVKVLTEMGALKEEYAQLAFGVLIIEDIAAIAMVSLLGVLGATGAIAPSVLAATVATIILFVVLFLAIGLVLIPRFIEWVSRFKVEEVLMTCVIGLAFASALLAERLGLSLALGAFLMGGILAESRAGKHIEHHLIPIRDLFTATFFVAVGMLLRPSDLVTYAWPIILITLVTIVGKLLGVGLGALLAGYGGRTSLKTAASMAQIGEFGFIIAGLGLTLGVIRPEIHPIAVAVCAITSLTTPLLMRTGPRIADALAPRAPRWLSGTVDRYARSLRHDDGGFAAAPDRRAGRMGTRLVIHAAWTLGLTILAHAATTILSAPLASAFGVPPRIVGAVLLAIIISPAAIFLSAFARTTQAYLRARALTRSHSPRSIVNFRPRQTRLRAAVAGLLIAMVLLAAATGIATTLLTTPTTHALLAAAWLAMVGLALHLWGHNFHARLERVLAILLRESEDRERRHVSTAPFGLHIEEVHITPMSRATRSTLAELDIRDRGASILSVKRGIELEVDPAPTTRLQPHDTITLAGRHRHVQDAKRALLDESRQPP